jgi:pimeloyl-ACP methyl ester carboxylesterase
MFVRRLVIALAVLASLVLAVTDGAAAAKAGPHLTIKGAAHESAGKLRGGFTVENIGTAKAPALEATVKLRGAPANLKVLVVATVQHASIPALAPGGKRRVKVKATIPKKAQSGNWSILACSAHCVQIGRLSRAETNKKKATPDAATSPTGAPSPPAPTPTPVCTPSSGPLAYTVEEPFHHVGECGDEYFGFVPASYDASSPMPLLIWMHGCGGEAEGDAWTVGAYTEEAGHGWLTLSLGGRDGDCWTPSVDEAKVIAALADFEAHFNVNAHRVILGGYSSGGDLAYRTGFRHSSTFAGLLIENSSPFRDTESTQAESLAAATTKFHIVHLAHTGDTEYPIAGVLAETKAVEEAGFPITVIQKPGEHYDSHTDSDLQEYLLPHIEDGWESP